MVVETHFKKVEQEFLKKYFEKKFGSYMYNGKTPVASFIAKNQEECYAVFDSSSDTIRIFQYSPQMLKRNLVPLSPVAHLYVPHESASKRGATDIRVPDAGLANASYVNPAHRNQGIATALYDFAEYMGLTVRPSKVLQPGTQRIWQKRDNKINEVREMVRKILNSRHGI